MLNLTLFGPLLINGRPAFELLTTEKARAVLVYLLLETGQPLRRAQLASMFWPTLNQRRALHNLTIALMAVRRLVPPHVNLLQESGDALRLCTDLIQSDVSTFTGRFTMLTSHHHRYEDGCAACAEWAEQALSLVNGPFLADLEVPECAEFNEWLHFVQEGVRDRVILLRKRLAAFFERCGRFTEAQVLLHDVLRIEPWREEVHRSLMVNLTAAGERSSALRQYQRCRDAVRRHFDTEPERETSLLFERIRNEHFTFARRRPPTLPTHLTRFFGRDAELISLLDQLYRPDTRLMSIIGLGGSGKSYLALEAARRLRYSYRDGAGFIPLAECETEADATLRIATELRLELQAATSPLEQLTQFLSEREMLLVLDNVEQIPTADQLIATMLAACPGVTILLTSRRPIDLQRELRFELGGFPLGDPTSHPEDQPALKFLYERLATVAPERHLSADEIPALQTICRLSGGLPLALEMAVHQIRSLPAALTAERLQSTLTHFAADPTDVSPRHHHLRPMLSAVWQQLAPRQQLNLTLLTVCQSPFDGTTAQTVIGSAQETLLALADARRHGICRLDEHEHFVFHPLIRAFLLEQRDTASDAFQQARRRHMQYFFQQLDQPPLRQIEPSSAKLAQQLTAVFSDIRAAWLTAVELGEVGLLLPAASALSNFLMLNGWFERAAELLESAATAVTGVANGHAAAARLLLRAAHWRLHAGQAEAAERAARFARTLSDDRTVAAHAEGIAACIAHESGQIGDAIERFSIALTDADDLPPEVVAYLTYHLSRSLAVSGDLAGAAHAAERCIPAARAAEDTRTLVLAESILATLPARAGDYARAVPLLEAALIDARRLNIRFLLIVAVGNLAHARAHSGAAAADVVPLCREVEDLARSSGSRRRLALVLHSIATSYLAVERLDEAAAALREGLSLAVELNSAVLQLNMLEAFATLAARRNHAQRARRYARIVIDHPQTTAYVRSCAERTLQSLPGRAGHEPSADASTADPLATVVHELATELASADIRHWPG